jgi:DnaJ-class molecular chaperone
MDIPVDEIFQAFFGGGAGESPFGESPFPGFPGFPGFSQTRGGPGGNVHFFFNPGVGGPKFMQSLQKPTPIIKTIEITMDQVLTGANIPLVIERWFIENGNKIFENETLYVDIPKGIDDNEIIILREKGNILNETIKGDVKLFIKINNTTFFIRSGLDLLFNKRVSLKDALCGFSFELKYVNGKMYTLNCNSGNIIHPGYKKILPNMGLTRDGHTGNLIIQFDVEFPEMMTEKQIKALKEIL